MTQPKHAAVGTESASLGADRYKVQTWVPKVQTQVELFSGAITFFPGQLPHFLISTVIRQINLNIFQKVPYCY